MLWMERGGWVMWPLLLLSVLAATLVIERFLFWAREGRQPATRRIELRCGACSAAELDLELLLDSEQQRLERGMLLLDTILAAAPMMGILGTVIGVIGAFEALATNASPDPMAVTGGISQALITTASGLVIALGVLFPLGFFRTRIRVRLSELEAAVRGLPRLQEQP